MYPNVVCFCGRPIGHLHAAFLAMLAKHNTGAYGPSINPGDPIGYILDQLGITKICCRTRIMTSMEFKNFYNVPNQSKHAPTIDLARPVAATTATAAKAAKVATAAKGKKPEERGI